MKDLDWGFLGLRKFLRLIRELIFFNIFEPENVVSVELVMNFEIKSNYLQHSPYFKAVSVGLVVNMLG